MPKTGLKTEESLGIIEKQTCSISIVKTLSSKECLLPQGTTDKKETIQLPNRLTLCLGEAQKSRQNVQINKISASQKRLGGQTLQS